ncbi:upd-c transporter [Apiospora phragmitis]|uniref:Upd-c transporter n=1 Tax=Apiospora phragmitis TaxID=2905665 RepID=A0ABR1TR98_9PEZI
MTPRSTARKRQTLRDSHAAQSNGAPLTPKVINAGPSLEQAERYGIHDQRPTRSKIMALAGRIFIETIPQWLAIGVMLGLIFGGCCSNVFALEAIIKIEPASGTLLTFVQFLFVAVTGYVSQFDSTRPPFFLTPNRVPIRRWLINIVLFFSINVLNNHAFSYDISVPVHIILRSGGSITTMIAGSLWGKKYSRIQIVAVLLLTVGVIMAAWSDSQTKTISAARQQRPLTLPGYAEQLSAVSNLSEAMRANIKSIQIPSQVVYLALNVLTQYACIRGVNLLAAASSALTVTIVLNIRKLVSLLLSIWLFGNRLAPGTLLGAVVVFSAGALYSLDGKKKAPSARPKSTAVPSTKEG